MAIWKHGTGVVLMVSEFLAVNEMRLHAKLNLFCAADLYYIDITTSH